MIFNFNLIALFFHSLFIVDLNTLFVNAQPDSCSIVSAIVDEGKSTLQNQFNIGFCKEWIIGPVTKKQRIMVSFIFVDLECEQNDVLMIYNEDKSKVLFDYCMRTKVNKNNIIFVMATAKYVILRLQTNSSRLLTATFDLVLLDSTISSPVIQTPAPVQFLTTSNPETTRSTTTMVRSLQEEVCPQFPLELTDVYGTIKSPVFTNGFPSNAINCSWVVRAPPAQRVYLVFDFINIPKSFDDFVDSLGCNTNYVSIASLNKPSENYKLCGVRRGVKLITTYNSVLINFVNKIRDTNAGFSLVFKVISDPSALNPKTTTAAMPSVPLAANQKCGIPVFRPIERIVGGFESTPNSWPWQVMITDGMIMCGASLIDNNWIVTAAHCTENINSGPIKAYLGMHNRLKIEKGKTSRYITQVIVHPNYMGRLTQWDFDIALMKLQSPVEFSDEIAPICLPPQGLNMATMGARGWVTGWGDTQGTGPANVLRQASISVKKNKECGASSDNMLCAGDKTPEIHDSCQGDSGGPFFMKNNNNYYLVGIVSWGYDCGGAGVYTKVSNFVDWINSVKSTYL